MKHADVEKLHEAGLITGDQREQIIKHYDLKEEGGRFLAIISMIGAVLVTAGIILLISSHWNEIPRGLKIFAGLALMLGAHAGGWFLREVHGKYRKTGEALHLIGSGLFLANIALVGQIYNLSSRAPNAILLWWLGIAALPWLLRSKAQHILLLLAFGLWFGLEINSTDSLIYFGHGQSQLILYALLGLFYLASGYCLRLTAFAEFSSATEKLGSLLLLIFSYPLTWKLFYGSWYSYSASASVWIYLAMVMLPVLLLALGVSRLSALSHQWRWTWGLALAAWAGLLASIWYGLWQSDSENSISHMVTAVGLFILCLLQIQVGIQKRSTWFVNLGIIFIALDIIAVYLDLFGSMARTGVMFLISGVFLIVFGVFLEKKRRKLIRQVKAPLAMEAQ